MGFFKKLKERLFSLDVEKKSSNKQVLDSKKVKNKPENLKDSSLKKTDYQSEDNKSHKYKKKVKKLEKEEEKKRLKAKAKDKRINKYVAGLHKSSSLFSMRLKELQSNHIKINSEYFEELENILIMSDISMPIVLDILDEVKKEIKRINIVDTKLINEIIVDKIFLVYANQSSIQTTFNLVSGRTNIILVTGVNGVGKTTSIAKLVNLFQNEGKKVLIAAADTFRAGAVEQLSLWSQKLKCEIIKPIKEGVDPSSVVYDAIKKIKDNSNFYDILIIDTAGRLQNKVNLMNELSKVKRVIQKEFVDAPHEIVLVIDATTGQNGIAQAKQFKDVIDVTGIILTKMDGTSKGGIILSIKEMLNIPVKYIGLGETIDDLQEFDLDAFIYGLTKDLIDNE